MTIKSQTDVAAAMKERLSDIMRLCDGDQHLVIEMYMEAHACLHDAEMCRSKYRWARKAETKSDLKSRFDLAVDLAQNCLKQIDSILYPDSDGEE